MRLTVYGVAIPQGSKTAYIVKNRAVVTDGKKGPALREWRTAIANEARAWLKAHGAPAPLDGPIAIHATFYLPRPKSASKKVLYPATRPDCDKLCRGLNDALTGIAYTDDSRIVDMTIRKRFAIESPPRLELFLHEITPEEAA